MPVIPTFENEVSVAPPPGPALADPNALSRGAQALSQAGGEVEDVANNFAQRYAEARRQADAANVVANGSKQLGDLQFKWSKVPDRQAATTGFNTEAAALTDKLIGGVQDPQVKSYVQTRLLPEVAARATDTQNASFGLESNMRVGQLQSRLAQYAQSAATSDNPVLQAKIVDDAHADIQGSVAAGWLHPEEGTQMGMQFASRVAGVKVQQFIKTVTEGPADSRMDPITVSNYIMDASHFPGLQPEQRQSLADQSIRLARTIISIQTGEQAHQDAQADKQLRTTQGANAATMIAQAADGKDFNADDLAHLVSTQQLSEAGFSAVMAAGRARKEGSDDPATAVRLQGELNAGTLTYDDINQGLADGKLKTATAMSFTRSLANGGQSEVAKSSYKQLTEAITSAKGAFDPGGNASGATRQLQAQADGEWRDRVIVGHEDPNKVVADMMPRYAPDMPPAVPRFGPAPKSADDIGTIWAKTRAAYQAGQLPQDEFTRQGQLLQLWRQRLAAQSTRAAANANAGTGNK